MLCSVMVFSFDAEVAMGKSFDDAWVGAVSAFDSAVEDFVDGVAERLPESARGKNPPGR